MSSIPHARPKTAEQIRMPSTVSASTWNSAAETQVATTLMRKCRRGPSESSMAPPTKLPITVARLMRPTENVVDSAVPPSEYVSVPKIPMK